MTPSPNRDERPVVAERVASRCPTCGRRLRGDCPFHGPVPRERSASDPPSSDHDASLPRIPGYRVKRRVAHGGFGTVYEAEPFGGGTAVAVKVPRDDREGARARLEREADVLGAIGPPHVPA